MPTIWAGGGDFTAIDACYIAVAALLGMLFVNILRGPRG